MMKMVPFAIQQSEHDGVYTLKLSGELDLSVVPQLQKSLQHVLERTDVALTLHLGGLTYIDSTGIGIIVSILKARDAIHAPFYVQEIPSSIRRLFDLTGLSGYLKEGTEAQG